MLHLRVFVANQGLLRIRAFFMSCPDFYSDIEDFAQILCRYLLKKLAFGTSDQVSKNPMITFFSDAGFKSRVC